ncbi:MAG: PAS domain S-box protein [Gemmatimonadota bacterium]|nr:MAG: PAS domain S-box protein [Gemmatimonadota bacterium]
MRDRRNSDATEIDELRGRIKLLLRAEESLKSSEERYRNLFEAARVGLYQTRVEDGKMMEANSALVKMMGYETKEEFFRDFRTSEHYADPERRGQLLAQLQRDGSVDWFEIDATKRDGSVIPIAISATLYPEREVLEGFVVDLSRQKEVERALFHTQQLYRHLVETVEDWIWEVDIHGVYTYVSPRVVDILGYEPSEVIGNTPFDFMSAEEGGRVKRIFAECAAGKKRLAALENVCRRKDGTDVILETSGVPFYDADGNLAGYRGVDRDITARVRAEEARRDLEIQLQHSQKLESLGVLAGGIAHDFNNILVAILGNADLALADTPENSPTRENLLGIGTAAKRAAELCKQMLAYAGRGRFVVEPVDLSAVVEEMAHMLEVSITKRAVLEYHFEAGLPLIEADGAQLQQVVLNLITNASDAIGDGAGAIAVSTGSIECDRDYLEGVYGGRSMAEGKYVFLEVSDTGMGMDDETQQRIFEPFFTTKFTGRGLGLAATLGIVRGHNGTFHVRSKLGRGSTFTVLFPVAADQTKTMPLTTTTADNWTGSGTALLVDDEESVRRVGQQMLQTIGFETTTACGGKAALDWVRDHVAEVDVVILDLTMPDMDGLETLHELRRLHPDLCIVLSSGYSEQEVNKLFAGVELNGFIQKPYELEKLRQVLHSALQPPSDVD